MAAIVMATELLDPALGEPGRLGGAAREMVPMAAAVRAAVQVVTMAAKGVAAAKAVAVREEG